MTRGTKTTPYTADPKVKATPEIIAAVRKAKHRGGKTIGEIAIDFSLSRATVSAIVNLTGRFKE